VIHVVVKEKVWEFLISLVLHRRRNVGHPVLECWRLWSLCISATVMHKLCIEAFKILLYSRFKLNSIARNNLGRFKRAHFPETLVEKKKSDTTPLKTLVRTKPTGALQQQ